MAVVGAPQTENQIRQLNTKIDTEHKHVEQHRVAIKKLEDRVQTLEKHVRELENHVRKLSAQRPVPAPTRR